MPHNVTLHSDGGFSIDRWPVSRMLMLSQSTWDSAQIGFWNMRLVSHDAEGGFGRRNRNETDGTGANVDHSTVLDCR